MGVRENQYQARLIERLQNRFPGCIILKNDASLYLGIPDLLILYKDRWGMLEVKASARAPERPNQSWWIGVFDEMSFGAFIFPENEDEVLDALSRSFEAAWTARIPER